MSPLSIAGVVLLACLALPAEGFFGRPRPGPSIRPTRPVRPVKPAAIVSSHVSQCGVCPRLCRVLLGRGAAANDCARGCRLGCAAAELHHDKEHDAAEAKAQAKRVRAAIRRAIRRYRLKQKRDAWRRAQRLAAAKRACVRLHRSDECGPCISHHAHQCHPHCRHQSSFWHLGMSKQDAQCRKCLLAKKSRRSQAKCAVSLMFAFSGCHREAKSVIRTCQAARPGKIPPKPRPATTAAPTTTKAPSTAAPSTSSQAPSTKAPVKPGKVPYIPWFLKPLQQAALDVAAAAAAAKSQ